MAGNFHARCWTKSWYNLEKDGEHLKNKKSRIERLPCMKNNVFFIIEASKLLLTVYETLYILCYWKNNATFTGNLYARWVHLNRRNKVVGLNKLHSYSHAWRIYSKCRKVTWAYEEMYMYDECILISETNWAIEEIIQSHITDCL